jgi:two-component system response regulator FixJ
MGQPSPRELLTKLQECAIDAQAIFEVRSRRAQSRTALAKLSDREHQVLDLVVAGLSNKEMARELSISPRTVEIHRMKMMGKLGASSSAQAVRMRLEALEN